MLGVAILFLISIGTLTDTQDEGCEYSAVCHKAVIGKCSGGSGSGSIEEEMDQ